MKKILALAACLVMLFSFAVPAAAEDYLDNIEKPYGVQYKVNSDGTSERITISCMVSDKIAEITADKTVQLGYGLNYAYAFIQLDYRIDGGDWQYVSDWDTVPDSSTYGSSLNVGETVKTLDLLYLTNETAVNACGDLVKKTADGKRVFDFENHSLEFRMRVALACSGMTNFVATSAWTEPVKVNRNVKQPKLPTEFAAPIVSDLAVAYQESDQMPYLTFNIKTPEDIKKAQTLYSTQIKTGFALLCYVDTGSGYEEVSISSSGSFYSNEAKNVYLSVADFDDEKRVKVKLKYMIYDADENVLYSEESEELSVVTPRWEKGKGILHAKCTVCGICRPIFGQCMFIVFGIAAAVILVAAVVAKLQLDKVRRRKEKEEAERRLKIEEEKAAYNALKQAKKAKNKKGK